MNGLDIDPKKSQHNVPDNTPSSNNSMPHLESRTMSPKKSEIRDTGTIYKTPKYISSF